MKAVLYGLTGFIVLLLIVGLILTFTIDSVVKSNIERIGTEMTGTQVTVDNVSVSIFSGEGTIRGFKVANPEGYQTEYAMQVEDFSIAMNLTTLFSDIIVVKEVIVGGPSIYVEQKLPDNNLQTILSNINEAVSAGTSSDAELVIEHFLLHEGSADLYTEVGGERSARVEISAIEMHDLGRGGGQQAVEQVVKEIAERVIQQALQAAVQSGGQQLRDAIEGIFN